MLTTLDENTQQLCQDGKFLDWRWDSLQGWCKRMIMVFMVQIDWMALLNIKSWALVLITGGHWRAMLAWTHGDHWVRLLSKLFGWEAPNKT